MNKPDTNLIKVTINMPKEVFDKAAISASVLFVTLEDYVIDAVDEAADITIAEDDDEDDWRVSDADIMGHYGQD